MGSHLIGLILLWTSTDLTGANHLHCSKNTFDEYINGYCVPNFNHSMGSVNYEESCPWPTTKSQYHQLGRCIEEIAFHTGCNEPHLRDVIFLEIHRRYFSLCLWSPLQDPSLPVLLVLIMPCVIATLLMPPLCARVIHGTLVICDPQRT